MEFCLTIRRSIKVFPDEPIIVYAATKYKIKYCGSSMNKF